MGVVGDVIGSIFFFMIECQKLVGNQREGEALSLHGAFLYKTDYRAP